MKEEFTLTVNYNGLERHYTTRLILQGYTHKFSVMVNETELFFEPDEEGHYRVVKMPWQDEKEISKIPKGLLSEIQQKIEAIIA
jgi:hypothetical protein